MVDEKNKPIRTFKAGAVHAAVWKRVKEAVDPDDLDYVSYSVTVAKHYKDAKGEWQQAKSFNKHDIPKVTLVMKKAYEFMMLSDEQVEG